MLSRDGLNLAGFHEILRNLLCAIPEKPALARSAPPREFVPSFIPSASLPLRTWNGMATAPENPVISEGFATDTSTTEPGKGLFLGL